MPHRVHYHICRVTACRQRLRELLEDCRIADAVYEDTPEQFAELTILERDDILLFEHEADHFRSAYAIALVPDRKEVRCRDGVPLRKAPSGKLCVPFSARCPSYNQLMLWGWRN